MAQGRGSTPDELKEYFKSASLYILFNERHSFVSKDSLMGSDCFSS